MKRKSFLFGLLLLSGALVIPFGCSKDKATETKTTTEVIEQVISVPSKTEEGKFENIKITFTAVIDNETEEILSKEVSQNLLDLVGVKTQAEFQDFIDQKILEAEMPAANALVVGELSTYAEAQPQKETISECLIRCKDNFTEANGNKIKGRGECRFGCWGEAAKEVLEKVLDAIK